MSPDTIGEIVSGSIPLFAGTLLSLYAYGVLPRAKADPAGWDKWHAQWGRFARIGGPLVALFGLVQVVAALA
jgi:hypothetical protein